MKPDDFLIRTTIRIETQTKNGFATGTGFFYEFFNNEQQRVPVIVTNKHVIKDSLIGNLIFSIVDNEGNIIEGKKHLITITEFEKSWILHPSPDIDLCIMPMATIYEEVSKKNIHLACATLVKENILTDDELNQLSKMEDVTIVGYPDGIWDSYNNLPILRKGITATPIQYNFENTPRFLIDAAIYGGSSGSPVFIFNQGSYSIGNTLYAGSRIKFVGIVYAVAQHTVSGNLKIVDIPAIKTPMSVMQIPNNIGVVIKANTLYEFENILREKLNQEVLNSNESKAI